MQFSQRVVMNRPECNEMLARLVDELAQDIRIVDGQNTLGAEALAEELLELGWTKL